MNQPWFSQQEIDDLCSPKKQFAAQIRFLKHLGLTVRIKPNGAPLVMRKHFEEVMTSGAKSPTATKCQPDRAGLIASFMRA